MHPMLSAQPHRDVRMFNPLRSKAGHDKIGTVAVDAAWPWPAHNILATQNASVVARTEAIRQKITRRKRALVATLCCDAQLCFCEQKRFSQEGCS